MKKVLSFVLALSLALANFHNVWADNSPTLKILTEAKFDEVWHFSEGMCKVEEGGRISFIDTEGNYAIRQIYTGNDDVILGVEDFHDGLAIVRALHLDESVGQTEIFYINKAGNAVLALSDIGPIEGKNDTAWIYDVSDFSEGLAICEISPNNDQAVYDKSGNIKYITDGIYFKMPIFADGLIPFIGEKGLTGYMNTSFAVAIPEQFADAASFNQGLAPAKKGGLWGFINKTGKFVVEPKYDNYWVNDFEYSYKVFNDGLASVQKNDQWGFIDKSGNVAVAFTDWDNGSIFYGGYSAVQKNGKIGYIDKKGNVIIDYQYDDANYFHNGVSLVGNKGEYKLINTKGEAVSDQRWMFDETSAYSDSPNMISYRKGNKWGLARIESGSPTNSNSDNKSDSNDLSVVFNGKPLNFNLPIISRNDRLFYPIRELSDALGADISWNADTKTATIKLNSNTVEFVVDSNKYKVNGIVKTMDSGVSPFINANRTYAPIRYITEGLGFTIGWEESTRTVTIK